MRPAFNSRTNKRGATALAPTLRFFFLMASDMWHPYGDLRLTATVPRVPARILNGTIVAGMVVLLHRCRTARVCPLIELLVFVRRVTYRVATRRHCLILSKNRSTGLPAR